MVTYNFNPSKENLEAAKAQNETIDVMLNFRTNSFTLAHTHAYWELLIMKENSAINVLDGDERVVRNRDFCLLRPENEHQIKLFNHIPPHYYNLIIRSEFLLSVVKLISPEILNDVEKNIPHYGTCQPHTHAEIIQLLDRIFKLTAENVVEKQRILRLIVIKLVSILLTPKLTDKVGSDLVSQLSAIMSNPENMTLPLSEIAKKMGYSQEHIIRTFQKNGLGRPNKLFNSIKLEYARSLLSSTDYRTADIAEQIGISDVSYFNKLFKRVFGVSPSTYRKNNPLQ
jgi:AraC-like DNA-binding protein